MAVHQRVSFSSESFGIKKRDVVAGQAPQPGILLLQLPEFTNLRGHEAAKLLLPAAKGLLLRLDPNDHKRLLVTLLYPPMEPGQTLMTQTVSTAGRNPPIELKIGGFNRVGGAVEHHEECQSETRGCQELNYSLRLSAPLFLEIPVTAVFVGQKAQNSSQMRMLREKAWALEKGDFALVQRSIFC